jgi:hypothetical protein
VLLALLAVTALALACGAAPGRATAPPPGFFGVTTSTTLTDQDMKRMGKAEVGTLRVMFNWGEIQPSPSGGYNFAATDRLVALAARNGVRLLPFFYGTPEWARNCSGVPARLCDRVDPLRSAAGRQGWPKFVAAVVGRYGGNGTFWASGGIEQVLGPGPSAALPIGRWQVWNEVNSQTFFQPKPSPKRYRALLESTSAAIRSADPSASVVLAGLFATPPRGQTMTRFLSGLYRISGTASLFDAVALHPYSPDLRGMALQIESARTVMRRAGDAKGRLLVTELGWGSAKRGGRGSGLYKGPRGQRKMLGSAFKLLAAKRKRYRLDAVLWFSWRDLPRGAAGNCLLCESFGLLRSNGKAKPAFGAFARFARR